MLLSAVLAAVIVGLVLTTANGKGKSKMEIIYDTDGNMTLTPQIYTVNKSISLSLFPVPRDNAVGTNSYREAVFHFLVSQGEAGHRQLF